MYSLLEFCSCLSFRAKCKNMNYYIIIIFVMFSSISECMNCFIIISSILGEVYTRSIPTDTIWIKCC